jgi:hypothetical protein
MQQQLTTLRVMSDEFLENFISERKIGKTKKSISNSNHLFLCFRFTSALPSLQIRFKAVPIDWTDSGHTAKVLKV